MLSSEVCISLPHLHVCEHHFVHVLTALWGEKRVWNLELVPGRTVGSFSLRAKPSWPVALFWTPRYPLQSEASATGGGSRDLQGEEATNCWHQNGSVLCAWADAKHSQEATRRALCSQLLAVLGVQTFWKRQVGACMEASSTFYDWNSLWGEAVIFSQGVWNQFHWYSVLLSQSLSWKGLWRTCVWCSWFAGRACTASLQPLGTVSAICRATYFSPRAVPMQNHGMPAINSLKHCYRDATRLWLPEGRFFISLLFFFPQLLSQMRPLMPLLLWDISQGGIAGFPDFIVSSGIWCFSLICKFFASSESSILGLHKIGF